MTASLSPTTPTTPTTPAPRPSAKLYGRVALALLTLLGTPGCQAVFGDFSIDTSKLDAQCTPGAVRCDTYSALQQCQADGTTWTTEQQCASHALCDLDAGTCTPPVCELDATRCHDSTLQRCKDDRTQWRDVQACVSPQLCDLVALSGCSEGACKDNALRCNDVMLETCVGGVWAKPRQCATRELCDASGSGACKDPVCAPGEQRCKDTTTLQTCRTGRNEFIDTSCDAPQHCNPKTLACE